MADVSALWLCSYCRDALRLASSSVFFLSTDQTSTDTIHPVVPVPSGPQLRRRDHHSTSSKLKKMVVSIVEATVPLNALLSSVPCSTFMGEIITHAPEAQRTGPSTTTRRTAPALSTSQVKSSQV